MATFSKKMMGKEVGDAMTYAVPHDSTGKPTPIQEAGVCDNKEYLRNTNVSVANSRSNDYPAPKTTGIKMRGTGCATKGVMSRGPMG